MSRNRRQTILDEYLEIYGSEWEWPYTVQTYRKWVEKVRNETDEEWEKRVLGA